MPTWPERIGTLLRPGAANGNGHDLSPRGMVVKAAPTVVAGQTGLRQTGGFLHEEQQKELRNTRRWMKIITEMRDNDPVIGAELYAIEMLIRRASWDMDAFSGSAADHKAADFIWTCLHDMTTSWQQTLAEILSFLPYGWALMEIRFKQRQGDNRDPDLFSNYDDGKYGWHSWEIRSQDTLWRWQFDQQNHAIGMEQQVIEGPNPGLFNVPFAKCAHFRNQAHRGNPEGRSLLRNAYRPWLMKTQIENVEGIGVERDLAGMPIAWVPAEFLKADAPEDMKAVVQAMQKMVTGVKRDEQEGIIMPLSFDDKGHKLYDFTLLSTGGTRQLDTSMIIQRYNQTIAMTVLADFILLGHTRVGSFALASSKTALFAMGMGVVLDEVADVINRQLIPTLMRMNGMDTSRQPKLRHGDVESVDLAELSQYITALTGAGMPLFPSPDHMLENWALAQAGMPVPEPEQWQAMEVHAQAQIAPGVAAPGGNGASPISGVPPPKTPPPGTPGSPYPWPGPGPGRGNNADGSAKPAGTSGGGTGQGAPASPPPVSRPYKPQVLNPISATRTNLAKTEAVAKFSPDQLRVPAGGPGGGEFAAAVAGGEEERQNPFLEGLKERLSDIGTPAAPKDTGAAGAAAASAAQAQEEGGAETWAEDLASMSLVPEGGIVGATTGMGGSSGGGRGGGGGSWGAKSKPVTSATSTAKPTRASSTTHAHASNVHTHAAGNLPHIHIPPKKRSTHKGEASGHDFRGNQYTGGIAGADGGTSTSEAELPLGFDTGGWAGQPGQTSGGWPSTPSENYVKGMGGGHMNLAYHAYFADGSQGLYKPLAGANKGEFGGHGPDEPQGADGQPDVARSCASFEVAQAMGMEDMVPRTVEWTPPAGQEMPNGEADGLGSLQEWQGGAGMSQPPSAYNSIDVERAAVFDYVTDNVDRHMNNYMTSAQGKPDLTDNDMTFGVTTGSTDNDRAGFLRATESISTTTLNTLQNINQDRLAEDLASVGLRDDQITAALNRLNNVITSARNGTVPWPTGLYLE